MPSSVSKCPFLPSGLFILYQYLPQGFGQAAPIQPVQKYEVYCPLISVGVVQTTPLFSHRASLHSLEVAPGLLKIYFAKKLMLDPYGAARRRRILFPFLLFILYHKRSAFLHFSFSAD